MKSPAEVLDAFENIRRAQRAGVYAPHKPLLALLALARVQRDEPRQVEYGEIDGALKQLLTEFGPSSAPSSRHYPFWHLATDGLWDISGPRQTLARARGATPTLGELRQGHVKGGFPLDIDAALRADPLLLQTVASRMLDTYFPSSLHGDIASAVGLDLSAPPRELREDPSARETYAESQRKRRDPTFRDRVLRAYEYRCCICGFDLRIGHMPAGLEAAHIQWHNVGGPDIEPNGLSLCALHHKLFDLGAFTIEPQNHRVVFSQYAISGERGTTGHLQFHGRQILAPHDPGLSPAAQYLAWNASNVFKKPARSSSLTKSADQLT
ncbi:phosphorothioated DNA-binding restriction endonuclease [Ramlibacter sp. MMS24-I3-19]|uniref:phosphorothioated DNA-binding restriction endonuclease n=1 Tax=Ramlibacter sp. MMS24-I3-19 TaxID=3416606 RepID=UPI003D01DCF0